MLQDLMAINADIPYADKETILSQPLNTEGRNQIADNAQNIDVDAAAVAAYLDANPWAAKAFESDQVAMRFKKEYGALLETGDELASSEKPGGEQIGVEATETLESEAERGSDSQIDSGKTLEENELASDDTSSEEVVEKNENQFFTVDSLAEEKPTLANLEISDNDEVETDIVADASTPSNGPISNLVDADAKKRVEAEKVKIQAARDWLEIIDTSIDELESGIGGNESTEEEDVAAQLDEYRELRKEKLDEIKRSESLIAELTGANTSKSEIEKSLALNRAKQDIDNLDSGQIAQLESKIPGVSQDLKYISVMSQIDRNYLPELASIELSGRSAPELARDRKELNENFIAQLDKFLEGDALIDINEDELLEIRRIKYLEIIQDENIMLGRGTFNPRTPEAQEYAALISDSTALEGTDNSSPEVFQDLSPELADDLRLPYSKNLITEDYDVKMLELDTEENDSLKHAKRLSLNEQFLRDLSSEIQLYSAALESISGESEGALSERYNRLIAERSAIVDDISADKEALQSWNDSVVSELNTGDSGRAGSVDSDSINAINALDTSIEEPDAIVAAIEKSYSEKLSAIEKTGGDETAILKKKADLNFNIAQEIDSIIDVQVLALDRAKTETVKNAIQRNIQELESIAADKRQEADRLMFESDEPRIASTKSNGERTPEALSQEPKPEDVGVLDIEQIVSPLAETELDKLKYVSLNANVTYNAVKPKLDSALVLRRNIQDKIKTYQAEEDSDKKRDLAIVIQNLKTSLGEKERAISREIAQSNQAELAYFENSNQALIRQLEVIGVMDGSDEEISAYKSKKLEIAKQLEALKSSENDTLSLQDRIAREREIIADMSALYQNMDAEIERVEQEDTLLSANDEATEMMEGRLSPYETLLGDPKNLKPESGRNYVAPIHIQVAAQITDERKSELKKNTEVLNFDGNFPDEKNELEMKSLVSKTTPVDDRGFELLKSNPAQMKFLVTAIQADSLKQMELVTKEYADRMSIGAQEKYREVQRLRNMATHESNSADKETIIKRANALEAEAKTNLEKAALSSYQAESLREDRIAKEEKLASLASELSSLEIAETRALIDNKTYKIIPSDLSTSNVAEKPIAVKEELSLETPLEADSRSQGAESEKVISTSIEAVAENRINSTDEEKLISAAGSWLAMVEIVAERNDFSEVEESLFIETDESIYSDRKPIPINPTLPNGLYFQVQIGAFRNPIPQDLYSEIAPVMGEKLNNGITRYRAGIFKNYGDAVTSRNLIRAKGYNDAFVVAYVDGERLTGSQAQDILRQLQSMDAESETLLSRTDSENEDRSNATPINTESTPDLTTESESPKRSVDYYSDPDAAEAKQVEITPGLFYTVQVGVYSKPVKLGELFNLSDLNTELTGSGYVRYTTGRFGNLSDARSRKETAINKGVADAFITAYYNGKRISISDAQEILDKEGSRVISPEVLGENSAIVEPKSVESDADNEKSYIVILGSFGGDIPQSLADLFLENPDWEIKKVEGPNNQSMYIASDFESKNQATDFLRIARDSGVNSAVLGELTNGQISAVGVE
ncbi:MAG TPA: hypothetical protein VJ911_03235 [Cryomorphaceae bacterium]|nr:hypothetical protein [Cryomorphaceae bacterium]